MRSQVMNRASDGVVAGVLKGMAEYFGWEPNRLRIVYAILTLGTAGFPGFILYLCLWWVMPTAREAAAAQTDLRAS